MNEEIIIINGVNVAECEKLGETIDGITCGLGKRIRFANEIITKHNLCEDNPNCYYKQLKRLQAENEAYKNSIIANHDRAIGKRLEEVLDENERLKEEITKHKANNLELLKYADEDKSDIDRLEQLYQDEHCDNLQLRKALEEIREIVKTCINNEQDGCYGCKYFDKCDIEDAEIPTRDVCKPIRDIIGEVLK